MEFSEVYLQLTRPRAHRYSTEVSKNLASQAHQEKQLELMKEKYEAAVAQVQKNLEGTKAALPEIHTKYEALLAKEKLAAMKAAKKAGAKTWTAAERIIKALPPAAPAALPETDGELMAQFTAGLAEADKKDAEDEDDGWEEVYNSHEGLPGHRETCRGIIGTYYKTYKADALRPNVSGSDGYWVKEGGEVYEVCGLKYIPMDGKLEVRLANESAGVVAAVRLQN